MSQEIKNPYLPGLRAIAGLLGLFFLAALIAVLLLVVGGEQPMLILTAMMSGGLFVLFSLIMVITWVMGQTKK